MNHSLYTLMLLHYMLCMDSNILYQNKTGGEKIYHMNKNCLMMHNIRLDNFEDMLCQINKEGLKDRRCNMLDCHCISDKEDRMLVIAIRTTFGIKFTSTNIRARYKRAIRTT